MVFKVSYIYFQDSLGME